MGVFIDDFERANGAPGNGWQTISGNPSIVSGLLGSGGAWSTFQTGASDPYYTDISCRTISSVFGGFRAGLICRTTGGTGSGFTLSVAGASQPYTLKVTNNGMTSGGVYASYSLNETLPPLYTLRMVWDNGHVQCYYEGRLLIEFDTGEGFASQYAGLSGYYVQAAIADVRIVTGSSVGLSAYPSVVGNYGQCTDIALTGANTNWTPGTPGSPIFTVNHGHISAQTINSSTSATITYCPDDYLGPVTITDPSTGTTTTIVSTSDPNVVPPGGAQLSQTAIDYIERSAIAQTLPTILNQEAPIDLGGAFQTVQDAIGGFYRTLAQLIDPNGEPPTGSQYIDVLWAILNAHALPDAEHNILSEAIQANTNAGLATLALAALRTTDQLSLRDVTGDNRIGEVPSIAGVWDQLGIAQQEEYASILAAMLSIWQDDQTSFIDIVQRINAIRTEGMYTLGDVKDWLDALTPSVEVDLSPVLDKLGHSAITVDTQLDGILLAATGAMQHALNANEGILAMRTGESLTLQSILDAIGDIPAGDLSTVIDAISALRGDETSTVKAILDSLTAYRGAEGYTVKSILDAIGQDQDNPNYTPLALIALLMLAMMGSAAKLAEFLAKLASGKLDLIVDIVGTIVDGADFFLDLWQTLKGPQEVKVTTIPAGYPGIDGVVLGEPIPFVNDLNVSLPMHGALIEISVVGEHPWPIKFSEPRRYGRLGTFAFKCDVERMEPIQPIQYLNQVATPKAIVNPTGLVIQCKQGTVGTVIPYTLPS